MIRNSESRRQRQFTKLAPVYIVWNDRWGVDKYIHGRAVEISDSGIRIEVPEPIEEHNYVTLCSAQGQHGTALVRSCIRKGVKYVLALELRDESR
jgi:hypothetical protein